MLYVKYYNYSIDDYGDLAIFITDLNGNQYVVAEITDCKNMTQQKITNLVEDVLYEKQIICLEDEE